MEGKPLYFITDVFAEIKYSGNQLATFIRCEELSDKEMQEITREISYSETTFILSGEQENGGYDVRIFTPGGEVDFAGHPTLGTAHIIRKVFIKQSVERVILNLKVGQVPVTFAEHDQILWMSQKPPRFGDIFDAAWLAEVLQIHESDIDHDWPIEEVSTGLPHTIVPLNNMDALKRCQIHTGAYAHYIKNVEGKVILVFCPQGYDKGQTLGVRVFPVYLDIAEDPATGSGNGCLAAYLVKNRYLKSDSIDIRTGQGYEIGRPSTLYLRGKIENDQINIQVGGKVQDIAQGEWSDQRK